MAAAKEKSSSGLLAWLAPILFLLAAVAAAPSAPASMTRALETRAWEKTSSPLDSRLDESLQLLNLHQQNDVAGYDDALGSPLAAKRLGASPDTAQTIGEVFNMVLGVVTNFATAKLNSGDGALSKGVNEIPPEDHVVAPGSGEAPKTVVTPKTPAETTAVKLKNATDPVVNKPGEDAGLDKVAKQAAEATPAAMTPVAKSAPALPETTPVPAAGAEELGPPAPKAPEKLGPPGPGDAEGTPALPETPPVPAAQPQELGPPAPKAPEKLGPQAPGAAENAGASSTLTNFSGKVGQATDGVLGGFVKADGTVDFVPFTQNGLIGHSAAQAAGAIPADAVGGFSVTVNSAGQIQSFYWNSVLNGEQVELSQTLQQQIQQALAPVTAK